MKKFLSVLMVVVIMASFLTTAARADTRLEGKFNARLTSAMNYDASTWMLTPFSQAALTCLLYADFIRATGHEVSTKITTEPSFVSRDGSVFTVAVPHKMDYIVITYSTLKPKETKFSIIKNTTASTVRQTFKDFDMDFYENDSADMYHVYEIMAEVLN